MTRATILPFIFVALGYFGVEKLFVFSATAGEYILDHKGVAMLSVFLLLAAFFSTFGFMDWLKIFLARRDAARFIQRVRKLSGESE
jgi:hypothetical protein